ncbi:MAG TPA: bacteriohopanetetrol glucosamine biosynthesis glycosyltransferase HpnI [Candidatus Baltobacteraceae bacterium]|nr:bacteriohopanetetrol glucosamine biosynthesis glycosyltransferase HpnI [Candidatus Baltobacteraceae bacterium]
MARNVRSVARTLLLAATAGGLAYTALALLRVRRYRRRAADPPPKASPPITVFKPLYGDEPFLYENLRSFCDQVYPKFQIVFCAADCSDPALRTALRLQREFPDREIDVVCGQARDEPNPKIANVLAAYHRARHGLIVVADSDIRVPREYLQSIAAAFENEGTGAVTCLYGSEPGTDLVSKLGAMYVNEGFAPSVLVAGMLEPLRYCFGATMAVRRGVLERIGGFAALAGRIGDDYELGQAVSRAGYSVRLASCLVHTAITERRLPELWNRELRWARTILAQRPAGFAGSVVTHVLPLAIAYAVVARTGRAAALLCAAAALRVCLHYEARAAFAPQSRPEPLLIPLRDVMSLAQWCASAFGRTVRWRSRALLIQAGGRVSANCNDSVTGWAESPKTNEAPASERR